MSRRQDGTGGTREQPTDPASPDGGRAQHELHDPSSGVRTVQIERVLRESLETVASPPMASALLERSLARARRTHAPSQATELASFSSEHLYEVVTEALGLEMAVQVYAHVSLFVGALRRREDAEGSVQRAAAPRSQRTVALVLGPGTAELRAAASRGTTLVGDDEVESLQRALALLEAQRGCVIVDARDMKSWAREPLRRATFDRLAVLFWGDAEQYAQFTRSYPSALALEHVGGDADHAEVLARAAALCQHTNEAPQR